jgi:hypothetical protein
MASDLVSGRPRVDSRKRWGLYPSARAGGAGWFVSGWFVSGWFVSGWFAEDRCSEVFLPSQCVNVVAGGFNHGAFVAGGGQDRANVERKFSVGELCKGFYFVLELFWYVDGQLSCSWTELISFVCHRHTVDPK